jgi:hypothetical protein
MNVTRGFNRVFIVLAVMWALYCSVGYPLARQAEATRLFNVNGEACSADLSVKWSDCIKDAQAAYQDQFAAWQFRRFYSWAWPIVLAASIGVPLIAYGLCRGAGKVAAWVYRGFRT